MSDDATAPAGSAAGSGTATSRSATPSPRACPTPTRRAPTPTSAGPTGSPATSPTIAHEAGGDFAYANLAVRGRLLADVIGPQLDAAIALAPDLVSMVGGGNDILRPKADLDAIAARARGRGRPAARGRQPTSCSRRRPTRRARPCSRHLRGRHAIHSANIFSIAQQHGCYVINQWGMDALQDFRLWAEDRIHMTTEGHRRVALNALSALGHDTDRADWSHPAAARSRRSADARRPPPTPRGRGRTWPRGCSGGSRAPVRGHGDGQAPQLRPVADSIQVVGRPTTTLNGMPATRLMPTEEGHDLIDLTREICAKELAPAGRRRRARRRRPARPCPREALPRPSAAPACCRCPTPRSSAAADQPYEVYLQVVEEIASAWMSVAVGVSRARAHLLPGGDVRHPRRSRRPPAAGDALRRPARRLLPLRARSPAPTSPR